MPADRQGGSTSSALMQQLLTEVREGLGRLDASVREVERDVIQIKATGEAAGRPATERAVARLEDQIRKLEIAVAAAADDRHTIKATLRGWGVGLSVAVFALGLAIKLGWLGGAGS